MGNSIGIYGAICLGIITVSALRLKSMLHPWGDLKRSFIMPVVYSMCCRSWAIRCRNLITALRKDKEDRNKINLFIAADCPQSFVLLQAIERMKQSYSFKVNVFILPPRVVGMSTSYEQQMRNSLIDASLFSCLYSFRRPHSDKEWFAGRYTELSKVEAETWNNKSAMVTQQMLTIDDRCDLVQIMETMSKVWDELSISADCNLTGDTSSNTVTFTADEEKVMEDSKAMLASLGYYGPGMVEFNGEWFSPNRLHHLERQMIADGLSAGNVPQNPEEMLLYNQELESTYHAIQLSNIMSKPNKDYCYTDWKGRRIPSLTNDMKPSSSSTVAPTTPVELFYSFRSPYSQVILPRAIALCKSFGVQLKVHVMLPMVIRGLPVPLPKRVYILTDCARDARLWNVDFGMLVDPINPDGKPVYRALSVYVVAKRHGKEIEFLQSFSQHVWGKGWDFGTNRGVKFVTDGLGLPWKEVLQSLDDPEVEKEWREITSTNGAVLRNYGYWGVPCLKYADVVVWGQDKLWVIEELLVQAMGSQEPSALCQEIKRICCVKE